MLNQVQLIGRLGKDPELRYTNQQTPICSVSLATTERRKQGEEWKEFTEWHNIVVWGKAAENLQKYCGKGKQIFVQGRLQTRKWQDKEGRDRYTTEIVATTIHYLGNKDSNGPRTDTDQRAAAAAASAPGPESVQFDDDDIPF